MSERTLYRVLVADDEPNIRDMLSFFLEQHNFVCSQAGDAESAIVIARDEKFDLIVMDVRMPGVSGMEALRAIKQDDPAQAVMMITGTTGAEAADEAMTLGASDFVTKPFSLQDMLGRIDEAINRGIESTERPPTPEHRSLPSSSTPTADPERWRSIARDVDRLYTEIGELKARIDSLGISGAA